MYETHIFYSVLAVSWTEFLWELYLSVRQHQVFKNTTSVPKKLQDVLDNSTFQKARSYSLDKSSFSILKEIYGAVLGTAMLWCFAFRIFWDSSQSILLKLGMEPSELMVSSLFILLLNVFNTVFSLPLKLYETFVVEEKHGFNKQTLGFFIKDKIKTFLVMNLIVIPLGVITIMIVKAGGDYFFIYLWLFGMVTLVFLMTIYPDYIAPLFDKYTPLPEGELRTQIEELAASLSFPLYKLYLVEGSKRSVHSNAYFYGFFKNKRIVLFDTLLKNEKNADKGCENPEILAILSHELGHWKFNHVTINLIIMEVNLFIQFVAFSALFKYQALYSAFGFDSQPVLIGLIVIMQYVFAPYNTVMNFCLTSLSRKMEFQADNFAKSLGKASYLKKALVKLHKDNLSFPIYDWLYSAWHHSHPTLLQRLEELDDKQD
uniref:CAAX prenyl protease n=1 Tax=Lygus hesperus TaxID=30085 RepID=A0A0A9Z3F8_LYGHE